MVFFNKSIHLVEMATYPASYIVWSPNSNIRLVSNFGVMNSIAVKVSVAIITTTLDLRLVECWKAISPFPLGGHMLPCSISRSLKVKVSLQLLKNGTLRKQR